jgi:hypothetical protein
MHQSEFPRPIFKKLHKDIDVSRFVRTQADCRRPRANTRLMLANELHAAQGKEPGVIA